MELVSLNGHAWVGVTDGSGTGSGDLGYASRLAGRLVANLCTGQRTSCCVKGKKKKKRTEARKGYATAPSAPWLHACKKANNAAVHDLSDDGSCIGTVFGGNFRNERVAIQICDILRKPAYEKEMLAEADILATLETSRKS